MKSSVAERVEGWHAWAYMKGEEGERDLDGKNYWVIGT